MEVVLAQHAWPAGQLHSTVRGLPGRRRGQQGSSLGTHMDTMELLWQQCSLDVQKMEVALGQHSPPSGAHAPAAPAGLPGQHCDVAVSQ